ncbi:MAG: hypothetical protein J0M12_11090 [Deltaproteobacteria bacterium]|nr:hypothetical protein [Deltaproteobacteria bacterium]
MKIHNSGTPERPSAAEVATSFEGSFIATPEKVDADFILHAYRQGYKVDGASQNSTPRSIAQIDLQRSVDAAFRDHIYSLTDSDGGRADTIFCHSAKIRTGTAGTTCNFLAEVRDRDGCSLLPASDGSMLLRSKGGLAAVHVRHFAKSGISEFMPLYSPRAYATEIDSCMQLGTPQLSHYLAHEACELAQTIVYPSGDRSGGINIAEIVAGETQAQFRIQGAKLECLVEVKLDPKSLRPQFDGRILGWRKE